MSIEFHVQPGHFAEKRRAECVFRWEFRVLQHRSTIEAMATSCPVPDDSPHTLVAIWHHHRFVGINNIDQACGKLFSSQENAQLTQARSSCRTQPVMCDFYNAGVEADPSKRYFVFATPKFLPDWQQHNVGQPLYSINQYLIVSMRVQDHNKTPKPQF